jgi:hypothetical protein
MCAFLYISHCVVESDEWGLKLVASLICVVAIIDLPICGRILRKKEREKCKHAFNLCLIKLEVFLNS